MPPVLLHISGYKIEALYPVPQPKLGFKPHGLWYSPDNIWIDWMQDNMPPVTGKRYVYELRVHTTNLNQPNPDRVLSIRNQADFDQFSVRYSVNKKYRSRQHGYLMVNWRRVAKDFAGIEIIPLRQRRLRQFSKKTIGVPLPTDLVRLYRRHGIDTDFAVMWYQLFDVASGCVWNPRAVKSFHLIRTIIV